MQATRVRSKAKTTSASKSAIDIRGTSTKIVSDFFEFSVNTILYQRNIYPPEDFKMVKQYGLNMLVSTDEALKTYLRKIMSQLSAWLLAGKVSRLVLAIIAKESREVLERWQFNITLEDEHDGEAKENQSIAPPTKLPKSEKEIHAEIQAIIRQITASVTFLPVIDEKCSFNILVYTGKDTEVPTQWQEDDAHMITGTTEQVKLRGFSTSVHKVDALVAYRLGDD